MFLHVKKQLLRVLFTGLLAVPFVVSATPVFNPDTNLDINLIESTSFTFDSYAVKEGVKVNYFAPKHSRLEIISEGDIFIEGDIWLSADSQLTLNSKKGKLTILGTVFTSGLYLKGKEGSIEFSHENLEDPSQPIIESDGLLLLPGSWYSIQYHPEPTRSTGVYSYDYDGTISSNSLATVPLPAPVLLFATALLSLFVRCGTKV